MITTDLTNYDKRRHKNRTETTQTDILSLAAKFTMALLRTLALPLLFLTALARAQSQPSTDEQFFGAGSWNQSTMKAFQSTPFLL